MPLFLLQYIDNYMRQCYIFVSTIKLHLENSRAEWKSFVFTHTFILFHCSFLILQCFLLLSQSFSLKTYYPFKVNLLMTDSLRFSFTNFFVFLSPKNFLTSPSFLKNIYPGYSIRLTILYFQCLKKCCLNSFCLPWLLLRNLLLF